MENKKIVKVRPLKNTNKARKSCVPMPAMFLIAVNSNSSCCLCGQFLSIFNSKTHLEHRHAWHESKSNAFDNLSLACEPCNLIKGKDSIETLRTFKTDLQRNDFVEICESLLMYDYLNGKDFMSQFSTENQKKVRANNKFSLALTNWFGIAKRNFKASLTTNDIQQHENLITAKEYAFERMKIYV